MGFCARGVVYVVVGLIALEIAHGGAGGERADKDGAVREIADRSFGTALLIALAIGLTGYIVWRFSEAIWGKRDESDEAKRTAKRLGSGAKGLLYAGFLASILRFLVGDERGAGAGGGDQQEESITATLLDLPAGQIIVGAVGAGIVGAGAYLVYRGVRQKFEKHLETAEMGPVVERVVDTLGTIGMAARGFVIALAGLLLIKAAVDYDPEAATGVDGTLKVIAMQTYGQVLLTITALGVIAYGLYSFAEARYRDL